MQVISRQEIEKNSKYFYLMFKAYNSAQFIAPPLIRWIKGLKDGARQLMWLGGVRSLKTSSAMQLCGWFCTGIYPDGNNKAKYVYEGYRFNRPVNVMVVGLKFSWIKDVLQRYFLETVDTRNPDFCFITKFITKQGSEPGTAHIIKVPHFNAEGKFDGESTITFGASQEQAKAFQGLNAIDMIFMDEEPPLDVYQECSRRLTETSNTPRFMFLTMWAANGRTPLIQLFMDGREKDVVKDGLYYIQSGWSENPFMSEETKQQLRTVHAPWQWDAIEFGRPTFGVGKVFEFPIKSVITDRFDIPAYYQLIAGVDPAATSNGTWGGVLLAVDADNDVVYVVKEYKLSGLTMAEHADNISKIVPDGVPIVCDPAGNGEDTETRLSALEYMQQKFHFEIIKAVKVKGAKEKTINKIYSLQRAGKFKIFNTCTKYLDEFDGYSRDEHGKIMKENDHILDASFYALDKVDYAINSNENIYNMSSRYGYRTFGDLSRYGY